MKIFKSFVVGCMVFLSATSYALQTQKYEFLTCIDSDEEVILKAHLLVTPGGDLQVRSVIGPVIELDILGAGISWSNHGLNLGVQGSMSRSGRSQNVQVSRLLISGVIEQNRAQTADVVAFVYDRGETTGQQEGALTLTNCRMNNAQLLM